jgi:serine/threonine-protein kinase RIO1
MAFVTHDPTRTPKRHRVHSCIGVQISANSRHHFDLEPPVPEARPFLIAPDQRILCLWPFFTKHLCPDLGRSSIYVFEELSDKSRCLTSVQMACIETKHEVRQEWSKPQVDHLWLWEMRQEIPARRELTEKNLHEELMSRGSKLIGKEFSTPRLGRLRLLNCLSIGSLASVYLAQSDTGQQVAIKILENDPGLTDTDRQRFQQECETLTRLAHDHLVKCLDHGEAVFEQLMYHWYAMDVAEGNLAHRLRDRAREAKGVIPWNLPDFRKAIRSEFEAILDALIHLHLSKLMHRDIKPSNVLIFDKNRLRLSDLGLLKDHRRQNAISGYHSSLGSVLGTFDYMSPEQREAKQLDFSSDIFSMGILLAESAMGVRPTIDYQRKRGSAIQPTPAFDQLGKPLQTLLEKMTQVQKQNRPQDASELREAYLQHL